MRTHYDSFPPLQEMEQMKSRIARDEVNVEVDSGVNKPELGSIMGELRSQYEGIVKANKEQAELWYQKKVGGTPWRELHGSEWRGG